MAGVKVEVGGFSILWKDGGRMLWHGLSRKLLW
jgi:hypothetical protein